MPRPDFPACLVCGEQFSHRSMQLHLPKCRANAVPCSKCGQEFRGRKLSAHIRVCKVHRSQNDAYPQQNRLRSEGRRPTSSGSMGGQVRSSQHYGAGVRRARPSSQQGPRRPFMLQTSQTSQHKPMQYYSQRQREEIHNKRPETCKYGSKRYSWLDFDGASPISQDTLFTPQVRLLRKKGRTFQDMERSFQEHAQRPVSRMRARPRESQ